MTREQLDALLAQFPVTFGLRGFPGDTFRVSDIHSYIGDDGEVVVYTERWDDAQKSWRAFAKGSVAEVKRQVTETP